LASPQGACSAGRRTAPLSVRPAPEPSRWRRGASMQSYSSCTSSATPTGSHSLSRCRRSFSVEVCQGLIAPDCHPATTASTYLFIQTKPPSTPVGLRDQVFGCLGDSTLVVAVACGGPVASIGEETGTRPDFDFNSPNGGFSLGNQGTVAREDARFDRHRAGLAAADNPGGRRHPRALEHRRRRGPGGAAQPKLSFDGELAPQRGSAAAPCGGARLCLPRI